MKASEFLGKPYSATGLLHVARLGLVFGFLSSFHSSGQDPYPISVETPQAPPPAPPSESRKLDLEPAMAAASLQGLTLYSIGEPSDDEQWFVELINHARINPPAEAVRLRYLTDPDVLGAYSYFQVNLDQMVADISALAPVAPLSIHPALTASARGHSLDMLTNAFQGHTGSSGSSAGSRITTQGYRWSTYGENVYAYAKSVQHGHAGFEVDWGFASGGMQSPPGHRLNLHNASLKEIGVGVVRGNNGNVGPMLITQDLASRSGLSPFVTGVAYYDLNGNGSYDPGEGLGGVTVTVSGSAYYAVSSTSGGYSVPCSANTTVPVTFSAAGLADHSRTVTVGSGSVKVDYVPIYIAPLLSGPDPSMVGMPNTFQFTLVGGATGYEWEQGLRYVWTGVEGAEGGLTNFIAQVTSGYNVVDTGVSASGTRSFHLAHPDGTDQTLTWRPEFRLGNSAALSFASRLGWASRKQVATVEISVDGGNNWSRLWSKAGTDSAGDTKFNTLTVSLAAYAGEVVRLRFRYDFTSGSYYPQTTSGAGWYFDDIQLTGAEVMSTPQVYPVDDPATGKLVFQPPAEGQYALRVRARVPGRVLDWGPTFLTTATMPAAALRVVGWPAPSGTRVTIDFEVTAGSPRSFGVDMAPAPSGPWIRDGSSTFTALPGGTRYRVNAAVIPGGATYYRVVANP